MTRLLAVIVAASFLPGCGSATREIASQNERIGRMAESVRERADIIDGHADTIAEAGKDNPVVVQAAGEIKRETQALRGDANVISKAKQGIAQELPKVKDIEPWYVGILRLGLYAAIIAGLLACMWYIGLGALLRPIFAGLGWFVPKATKTEAKFDAELLELSQPTPEVTQRIAARRAVDPFYEAELKRQRQAVRAKKGSGK